MFSRSLPRIVPAPWATSLRQRTLTLFVVIVVQSVLISGCSGAPVNSRDPLARSLGGWPLYEQDTGLSLGEWCGWSSCDITYQYCDEILTGLPQCFLCADICHPDRVGSDRINQDRCLSKCPVYWLRVRKSQGQFDHSKPSTTPSMGGGSAINEAVISPERLTQEADQGGPADVVELSGEAAEGRTLTVFWATVITAGATFILVTVVALALVVRVVRNRRRQANKKGRRKGMIVTPRKQDSNGKKRNQPLFLTSPLLTNPMSDHIERGGKVLKHESRVTLSEDGGLRPVTELKKPTACPCSDRTRTSSFVGNIAQCRSPDADTATSAKNFYKQLLTISARPEHDSPRSAADSNSRTHDDASRSASDSNSTRSESAQSIINNQEPEQSLSSVAQNTEYFSFEGEGRASPETSASLNQLNVVDQPESIKTEVEHV